MSALKAVPYFDVNVVDYKARWVILSAWLNLTNNYLSFFRVYPFLKQIEVSYSYPQLYSLPTILLSLSTPTHSPHTTHTLHTPHTDEPQLWHFHGHARRGTDSHALPTRLGWSIWNVSSHHYNNLNITGIYLSPLPPATTQRTLGAIMTWPGWGGYPMSPGRTGRRCGQRQRWGRDSIITDNYYVYSANKPFS